MTMTSGVFFCYCATVGLSLA